MRWELKKGLVLFFILPHITGAQTLNRPVSSVCFNTDAYSTKQYTIFCLTANPSVIAMIREGSAGISGERKFLLKELSCYTAVLGIPTHSGNFGLQAAYSGFSEYAESQLGLVYGRRLGKNARAGIRFHYDRIQIAGGYGGAAVISADAGFILQVSEKLSTGTFVKNFVSSRPGGKDPLKLPAEYHFGAGYDASEKFYFGAELEKTADRPLTVNAGFCYRILPQFLLRAGIVTATTSAWFGAGFRVKKFRLDICSGMHPQLGITPGLQLQIDFGQKSQ